MAGACADDSFELETRLIPDEQGIIEQTLCELVDEMACHLVLTTGGTGPARRDVTPDATAIADRVMPGFGEQMRQVSLHFVPTAILSRQVGVIRKQALILNLLASRKPFRKPLKALKMLTARFWCTGSSRVYLIVYSCLKGLMSRLRRK